MIIPLGNASIWRIYKNRFSIYLLLFCLMSIVLPIQVSAKTGSIINGKQKIKVNYSEKFTRKEQQQSAIWLKKVTVSLLKIYGQWPKDRLIISVRKTSRGHGPVPWGEVERNDINKVTLFINPDYGFKAIADDWTVYHELSHLLLPYRGYGDLWISEGLASYYQNIIQVRAGRLSESQFWDNITSGFERGKKQTRWSNMTLAKISDNMRQYRDFMRVHWSGVLFWLQLDVKVRWLSHNQQSLDTLLLRLKICCENEDMSAREIMHKLDKLSGYKIFMPTFIQFRESYKMPNYIPLLRKLGVKKINKQAQFFYLAKKIVAGSGAQ